VAGRSGFRREDQLSPIPGGGGCLLGLKWNKENKTRQQSIGALLGPERTTICEGGCVSLGSHCRYQVFLVGGGGLRVCCQVQSGREHLFS